MIFLLIAVYIAMFWLEGPILLKRKQYREFWAFSSLWFLGLIFNSLQVLNIKIVSPFRIIQYIIEDILKIK